MISLKASISCARISLNRFFGSKKSLIALGVSFVFCGYAYIPLTRITYAFHETIPPAAIVFYLSNIIMIVLQGGMDIYLFSDVLNIEPFSFWVMGRSGRLNYITGQLIYLLFLSLIYVIVLYGLSIILTFPVLGKPDSWGKIFYSLAETPEILSQRTGIELIYPVNRVILNKLQPHEAVAVSLLFLWLDTVFAGLVILFFTTTFHRIIGIIAAGILTAMPVFSLYAGAISIGTWLKFISPLSWSYIGQMDWFRTGGYPSPEYVIVFLTAGILVLGVGTIFIFIRKDIE